MAKKDYMALTPAERRKLEEVRHLIDEALAATDGSFACSRLESAYSALIHITQLQWWRTR